METQITQENAGGNATFEKYKYKRWLLLAMGALVMFTISLGNAWSVLMLPIAVEFPEWTSALMMGFTVFMITYSLCGILSGIIISQRKGQVQLNLLIAAILLLTSFIITSQTKNLFLLYFSFGVLGGAGTIFAYNSILSSLSRWFQDMWGIISGILLMCYGLGGFLIGKIYAFIISCGVGWRIIFIIFGITLAIILIFAAFALIMPPENYKAPDARKPKIDKYPIEAVECTPLQMIKRPSFWLIVGMGCCLMMPTMAMSSSAANIVKEVAPELAITTISTIVGLISIFNAVGRIATGFLNDWGGLRCNILVSSVCVVVGSLNMALAVYIANLPYLIFSFILFGFCMGMTVDDGVVTAQKFYGQKNYHINLQIILATGVINSLGALILPTVFNWAGSFAIAFLVISAIAIIGLICSLFVRKP